MKRYTSRLAIILLFFAGLAVIFSSCNIYPDSDARLEDLDMVLTAFNEDSEFGTLRTFALPDTVFPVSADTTEAPEYLDKDLNDFILSTLRNNLEALGFEEVARSDDPDLAITAGYQVVTKANVTYYCNPYYGWGYGWGYPGYGWGYPGYGYGWCPTYAVVDVYDIGSLLFDMINLRDVDTGAEELELMWQAVIRGILSSSTSNQKNRIKAAIDQAFDQSQYLEVTQ